MKAGQSVIPADLYLFCSHLARGNKYLKNNQYLDLFYFCLTRGSAERNHWPRRDFNIRPSRIAAPMAG
ncbi:hypothetical protein MPL3356_240067 [Mesorhizobium plurifarium]|uniref:Uncharacterized protein n=1 Tax=Mesorhizobium plurifarium TaxID=69974 RepID=A0A090FEM2_MESPL|nr:hypothetical protein MPL3356_240067 [Mesorhizobium plurifarium]